MSRNSDDGGAGGSGLTCPLVLIGLMGAGKTSVGHKLAERLNVPFRDSDYEVELAADMSVAEIFECFGEAGFRDGERRVIARLLESGPQVLATGGGAWMQPATRAAIRDRAVSVWLRADLDLLVARTAGRAHRPLLNAGDPRKVLADLIETRYPVYAEADVTVESEPDLSLDAMARRIQAAVAAHARESGRTILREA